MTVSVRDCVEAVEDGTISGDMRRLPTTDTDKVQEKVV